MGRSACIGTEQQQSKLFQSPIRNSTNRPIPSWKKFEKRSAGITHYFFKKLSPALRGIFLYQSNFFWACIRYSTLHFSPGTNNTSPVRGGGRRPEGSIPISRRRLRQRPNKHHAFRLGDYYSLSSWFDEGNSLRQVGDRRK